MTRLATLAAALALLPVTALPPHAHAQALPTTSSQTVAKIDPVVARWAAAWNNDDAAALAALFANDGTYEDMAFQVAFEGPGGVARWLQITSGAIPDAKVRVEETFRSEDRIAVRWTFSGTPVAFGPVQGTGRSFSVPVLTQMDLRNGRLVRVRDAYNLADVLRQVGLEAGPWTPPTR